MILWAIFTPLAALALQGLRRSIVWFVAFFAELVVLALLDLALSAPGGAPDRLRDHVLRAERYGLTLTAYVMLGYFVEQRERAHRPSRRSGAVRAPPAGTSCPDRSPNA